MYTSIMNDYYSIKHTSLTAHYFDLVFRSFTLSQGHRDVIDKLTIEQLRNKIPDFSGTRILINIFTRTRRWALSWATRVQYAYSHLPSMPRTSTLYLPLRFSEQI
jgi:hypothetical protein